LPPKDELFHPKSEEPSITEVFPRVVWRDTNTLFTIVVKGIKDTNDIIGVCIDGVNCPPTNRYSLLGYEPTNEVSGSKTNIQRCVTNGVAIQTSFSEQFFTTNTTNLLEFTVLTRTGGTLSKTVAASIQSKNPPEAAVTITRDSTGKVSGFNIKPGQNLSEQELLEAVKSVLEKSESPQQTTVFH
jgi:hypothetical protein